MQVVRLCSHRSDPAWSPLDGVGASITGGRWNSPGKRVAYTASCGALAMLEYLVHSSTTPKNLILSIVVIPDSLDIERSHWAPVDLAASRQIGDEWIARAECPVLEVPSVLAPRQKNYLINPLHPLFKAIKITDRNPFAFDSRLISFSSTSVPTP